MNTISTGVLALLLILFLGVASAQIETYSPFESDTGRYIMPAENLGGPWYHSGYGITLGDSKNATIKYNKTYNNVTVAGTDLTVLKGLNVKGSLSVTGATISNGKISGATWVDNKFYVTSTSALNRTKTTQLESSTKAYLNRTRATQLDVAGLSALNRTQVTQLEVSGTTYLNATAIASADSLTENGVIIPQAITLHIGLSANSANGTIFIPIVGNIQVLGIQEAHSVACTGAAATATVTVVKLTGTQAPATAGVVVISNTFNLKGTPETIQTGVLSTVSGATKCNLTERLGIRFNNPLTSLAGGDLSLSYKRIA